MVSCLCVIFWIPPCTELILLISPVNNVANLTGRRAAATGVNAVSFFAPQIFGGISTFAASAQGPLYAALMVNGVQLITTIVTVFIVDKVGRRTMLFTGSCVGLAADIAVAVVFAEALSPGQATLSFGASIAAICLVSGDALLDGRHHV